MRSFTQKKLVFFCVGWGEIKFLNQLLGRELLMSKRGELILNFSPERGSLIPALAREELGKLDIINSGMLIPFLFRVLNSFNGLLETIGIKPLVGKGVGLIIFLVQLISGKEPKFNRYHILSMVNLGHPFFYLWLVLWR